MVTITLPKYEYTDLKARAEAYDRIVKATQAEVSLVPPVQTRKKIVAEFRATKKYSKEFIADLQKGLKRSKFFTA